MACRTTRPKRELLRIVRTPTGAVVADDSGRLAGRGAYVCVGTDCLIIAIKKGALARALETPLPAAFLADATGAIPTHTIEGGARGQE
ncbi:MAG TPA: YlxR family protein [Candidatus Limnocylindrales bacterium]|nr:YlxR family protein [Candidatus Limnocylindrales bacterium]